MTPAHPPCLQLWGQAGVPPGAAGTGEYLTYGSYCDTMHTMNETQRNPNIRVTQQTRKDLKIIAAHTGENMLEVVARLAQVERARIEGEEEKRHAKKGV